MVTQCTSCIYCVTGSGQVKRPRLHVLRLFRGKSYALAYRTHIFAPSPRMDADRRDAPRRAKATDESRTV